MELAEGGDLLDFIKVNYLLKPIQLCLNVLKFVLDRLEKTSFSYFTSFNSFENNHSDLYIKFFFEEKRSLKQYCRKENVS
jgi:hypothetical protein